MADQARRNTEDIIWKAGLDFDKYREKLDRLKRNKENVSLELLTTKYQKSYLKLTEEIRCMTKQILQSVVSYDLFVESKDSGEILGQINQSIDESGLLVEINHAVYRKQDADLVLDYIGQFRKLVHQMNEERKEKS